MLSDFHTHSRFSGDSNENPEKMIQTAIKHKMKHICFTDHLDFDYFDEDINFELDTDAYYPEIAALRDQYSSLINVCIGIETGLEPHLSKRLDDKINKYPFDFIIGSSHLVNGKDPYYPEFFKNRTNRDAFMEYFEAISKCIDSCSNFDVYGHLDYVVRYADNKNADFNYSEFTDIIDVILKKLIYAGKGIEINTGGYLAGLGTTNPCPEIIKRYHDLGGEIITIGSDAHCAENIGKHFDDAKNILIEKGFDHYCVFQNRTPLFISI